MPPVTSKVAIRLVVFAVPVFCKPKFTVTVSVGSIAPLAQPSAASVKLLEVMMGTRIGRASTAVTVAAVLLAELGSVVGEATVRVLVISPAALGVTTKVKLVVPP